MKWRKIKTVYRGMDTELADALGIFLCPYSICRPKENLIINDMDFSEDKQYRCAAGLVEDCIVVQRCRNGYKGYPEGMVILPNDDFETLFEVTSDDVQKHERQFYDAEKDQES